MTSAMRSLRNRVLTLGLAVGVAACLCWYGWHLWQSPHDIRASRRDKPRIPKDLTVQDVQRPLDLEILDNFAVFEKTGLSSLIDANLLKPLMDDVASRQITSQGIELIPEQFPDYPELYLAAKECSFILHLPMPRIFVTNGQDFNAGATNMVDPIILLSAGAINACRDRAELRFVIGHEMGHVLCRHVKLQFIARTLFKIIPDEAKLVGLLPLMKWSRECEMSADNAGLVCCQDEMKSEQVLLRLISGLPSERVGRVNVEAFLKQQGRQEYSTVADAVYWVGEVTQTHPFVADRIKAMRGFASSSRYRQIWERK